VTAVLCPSLHNRGIGFVFGRQSFDRRKVALEISAGNTQSGFEITVRSDPPVKLERRDNL
jgi:hypothetical protein